MMEINIESVVARVPAMIYVYAVNHETGESSFPFVSDHCEQMFGFPASQIMENPKVLVNCILEDEAEQYAAAVMESMKELSPFDRMGRMRRADGRIIHVHYKSTPRLVTETKDNATDGQSTVSTFTVWDGIVFDVTKQVSNEENNRKRLQETIDKSLQPMFEIDTQGCVTEWNGAMAKVIGYSREQVVGKPILEFMPEEEKRRFLARLPDDEETESQLDCEFLTRANQTVFLHARCTTSRDANGSNQGQLFCCQDVTTMREAEKEKNEALELVDAERGLTEWLSHEVRNPLSVAMEAAMALKDGDDDTISCLDLISESIRYIVDLLTNMLDLNKCLNGKITLYPAPCRIREEVLLPTYRMMSVRNSQVDVILSDGEEVTADVDKLRLRQVVTNLVSNALKFTTKGFVRIDLQQPTTVASKRRIIRVVVSDSGCGVDPSDYDVLFSKWEQLGSTMNGTGIGLCLCRALVTAMGGRIYLEKEYDSGVKGRPGAQFIVDLPISTKFTSSGETNRLPAFESLSAAVLASRVEPEEASDVAPREKGNADFYMSLNEKGQLLAATDTFVRGRFRLLVVDDDKMGRKLLRRRFSRLFPDAQIDEVASGEEAVVEAEKTNYDIITIDHFMAVDEMSGEETIRSLRTKDIDALIVGISGNSKEKEHLSAGAQDFFQKPIPSDDVIVSRLISKLSPPSNWKVLVVDDVEVNMRFLCRRLCKVAAPHFTSLEAAEKRWKFTTLTTGEEAIAVLRQEWFDLVVLDQHLGEGMKGLSVAHFVRESSLNKDAIVVLNSGSFLRIPDEMLPCDLLWPKPLPSNEEMRFDLCLKLLASKDTKSKGTG